MSGIQEEFSIFRRPRQSGNQSLDVKDLTGRTQSGAWSAAFTPLQPTRTSAHKNISSITYRSSLFILNS
jgi:hypothetical protein